MNFPPLILYSFLTISSLILSGCVPALFFGSSLKVSTSSAEERGLGGVISDTALKNTISYRLFKHSMELFSKISVTVHQSQAFVTGVVDTPVLKQQALNIVKSVGGIKEVIDEITVASINLSQVATDSWITTQLTSSLAIDPDIQSINYKIKTENGIVYLTGIAQNKEELVRVTDQARTTAQVKKVISHVKIKNDGPDKSSSENLSTDPSPGLAEADTDVTVVEEKENSSTSFLADLE